MNLLNRNKDKTTTTGLGIWDVNLRAQKADNLAKLSASNQPNKWNTNKKNAEKPRKRWGLWNVFWAFTVFIVLQFVFTFVLFTVALGNVDPSEALNDPTIVSDEVFGLLAMPLVLIAAQMSMYIVWIGYAWYATAKQGLKSFAKDFWLKFKKRDIPLGFVIAMGLMLAQLFILWLIPTIFPDVNMEGTDNASFLNDLPPVWFAIIGFGIVGIIGPFCEELFFRGFLFQGLLRHFRKSQRSTPITVVGQTMYTQQPFVYEGYLQIKRWMGKHKYSLSVIISSTLFGLMHFQGVETFGQILVPIVTGLIGVVLALLALKTRRLGLGIMVHIFFNSTSVLLSILT